MQERCFVSCSWYARKLAADKQTNRKMTGRTW